MKIITANGKKIVKISKQEWLEIGQKNGWMKTADTPDMAKEYEDRHSFLFDQIVKNLQGYKDSGQYGGDIQSSAARSLALMVLEEVSIAVRGVYERLNLATGYKDSGDLGTKSQEELIRIIEDLNARSDSAESVIKRIYASIQAAKKVLAERVPEDWKRPRL